MINKTFFIDDSNAEIYISKIGEFIKNHVDAAKRSGVVLGMSGGIDCSVVARLCQNAGVKATLLLMPDGDSMKIANGKTDAFELIDKFNFDYKIIDIGDICRSLEGKFDSDLDTISKINIRPRIRMTTLYAYAQANNAFVIGTGNLDERLLGYFTKWGDGACDLNPLGMLTKSEVKTIAHYLMIPDTIIEKKPSAGLFEGQTDEDELGFSYDMADMYIIKGTSGDPETDSKIAGRISFSAHKLAPIPIFGL